MKNIVNYMYDPLISYFCPFYFIKVSLFAERDIEIMFSIFDLTNRGYVDKTQYLKG